MSELNQFYQELPPLQYLTLTWPVAGAEGEIHYKLIKEKQQPKLKLIFWGDGKHRKWQGPAIRREFLTRAVSVVDYRTRESPAILPCSHEKQRLLCISSSTYSSFWRKLENSYIVFINKRRGQDFCKGTSALQFLIWWQENLYLCQNLEWGWNCLRESGLRRVKWH